jgi:hypothetical protein
MQFSLLLPLRWPECGNPNLVIRLWLFDFGYAAAVCVNQFEF